jgi:hypothetical protein
VCQRTDSATCAAYVPMAIVSRSMMLMRRHWIARNSCSSNLRNYHEIFDAFEDEATHAVPTGPRTGTTGSVTTQPRFSIPIRKRLPKSRTT